VKLSLSAILWSGVLLAACSRVETNPATSAPAENRLLNTSPVPEFSPERPSPVRGGLGIRSVDFQNLTFPWTPYQGAPDSFTLQNGKKDRGKDETGAELKDVEYGDVTGDGTEDAVLSISPESGGNCQCYMVYVYALSGRTPTLLWSFDTWDRAEGGFKRAYADKGQLVVELFGDDKFENDEWHFGTAEGKFKGLCCPTTYTRFKFRWNGEKFLLTGRPELFDYDQHSIGHATR